MHLAQPVHLLSPSTLVVVCGAPSSRCPTRGKLRWRFFRSCGGALSCVAEGAAAASVFSNKRHLRMFFAESPNFWNSALASCLYVYLYPRSHQFRLFISVAVDVLDPPRAKYGLDRARRARHASGAVHSSARIMRLSGILTSIIRKQYLVLSAFQLLRHAAAAAWPRSPWQKARRCWWSAVGHAILAKLAGASPVCCIFSCEIAPSRPPSAISRLASCSCRLLLLG
jgi:hypothetical protein